MKINFIKVNKIAFAVYIATLQISLSQAQEVTPNAAPAPSPPATSDTTAQGNTLNLDQVVVTGTPIRTSKMKSSSSLSTLDSDQIQLVAPTSTADLLRDIPGVHSEASGGEGNANVTVRGIPISAGGSRYISFQEDGLPVLLNGDYAFVTPDMYLRIDDTLDHVEAVRGGPSAILASNSPAGIINFITKTGTVEGGNASVSKGLGFDESRFDFDYGHHLSDSTRFFIGGFFREGEGVRDASFPIEYGGQIKGNITQEFGDDSFIRLSFKLLNDQTPVDMPVAYMLSNANPTKSNPATISSYPGINPLTASYYSPYWPSITMRSANNTLTSTDLNNGLTVREQTFGVVGSFNLGDGWYLDDSLRKSNKGGSFLAGYPTGNPFAAMPGTLYAAGPLKGQSYTGLVTELSAFDANFDDMGSTVNALKISNTFKLADAGKLTTVFGWDLNIQQVGVTQNLPHFLMTSGTQPMPLQGTNLTGIATDSTGLLPDASNWSEQTRSVRYAMDSPYITGGYDYGPITVDAGVRRDSENASGCQSNTLASGSYLPGVFPTLCDQPVSYSVAHNSYSMGLNYNLTRDLALFTHYSDGVAFNVVERMGGPFDGSAPIPLNTVKQFEGGVKWRQGGFNSFVTMFNAKTSEENFDVTTDILTQNTYSANGVEIESSYNKAGFNVSGGFTYVDAKISSSNVADTVGDEPHRLAPYTYQISPSYQAGNFIFGGSMIGTAKSYGDDQNTIIQPAFYTVNLFDRYQINALTAVLFSANNLFNRIGWTEYDAGQGARSINGRTMNLRLAVTF